MIAPLCCLMQIVRNSNQCTETKSLKKQTRYKCLLNWHSDLIPTIKISCQRQSLVFFVFRRIGVVPWLEGVFAANYTITPHWGGEIRQRPIMAQKQLAYTIDPHRLQNDWVDATITDRAYGKRRDEGDDLTCRLLT